MKDISIYFEPIENTATYAADVQWGNKVIAYVNDDFPVLESKSIVVFSIESSEKSRESNNLIRKHFYQLYSNHDTIVYDLGFIAESASFQDQSFAVKEVVGELYKKNIIPVILTDNKEMLFSIYQSYEILEQTINLTEVSPTINYSHKNSEALLTRIFTHEPGFLFNYTNLGYQSYYTNPKVISFFDELYFDAIRLGILREDIKLSEPYFRNSDVVFIDFNSVRKSDFESNALQAPNGFTGEDICRMTRYSGISDKLSQIVFHYTNSLSDADAVLLAQSLWYFIDGFNLRKGDFPVGSKKDYKKFVVGLKDFSDQINFYKSNKSSRWWMEVPYPGDGQKKFARHYLVPCNKGDYDLALRDELPELWWKTYQKLT